MLGIIHIGFGVAALVLGGLVWFLPKGRGWHKPLGWAYVLCMVGLNGSAFGIYHFTGHFGPFHVLALVSLITTSLGVIPARWKWPAQNRWITHHYVRMGWSYIGLWAATATEATIRLPFVHDRAGAIGGTLGATALVLLVGGAVLSSYRVRMQRHLRNSGPIVPLVPSQSA